MKTTNYQDGLIRIVESEEYKISRLEKKAKTYDNLGHASVIAMATSFGTAVVGGVLLEPAFLLFSIGGAFLTTTATTIYFACKHDKAKEQLKNLYEK